MIQCTKQETMNKFMDQYNIFTQNFSKINDKPLSEKLCELEDFSYKIPLMLSRFLKKYYIENCILDNLKIQLKQIQYNSSLKLKQKSPIRLEKQELECSLLFESDFEEASVYYNNQKAYVEWINSVSDQLRFFKNQIDTQISIIKLRLEVGN